MNTTKLLQNIYYAALHHKELNLFLMKDLLRDDKERDVAKGMFDAYSYIILMIENNSIGQVDYKKVFKMKQKLRYIFDEH